MRGLLGHVENKRDQAAAAEAATGRGTEAVEAAPEPVAAARPAAVSARHAECGRLDRRITLGAEGAKASKARSKGCC